MTAVVSQDRSVIRPITLANAVEDDTSSSFSDVDS